MQFYTIEKIRQLEQYAINQLNINAEELMQKAANAASKLIVEKFPNANSIAIFCGGGNNGGDGYVLGGLLAKRKKIVTIYSCVSKDKLKGEAAKAYAFAFKKGVKIQDHVHDESIKADLIVDSLLGIGIKGEVSEKYAKIISHINQQRVPKLAIDVPSGLNCDTGCAMGEAVIANATITFIGMKSGLFTADGPDHTGEVFLSTLDLPIGNMGVAPFALSLEYQSLIKKLKTRKQNSHKGSYGHAVIIGGGAGMPGALDLAASACLHTGAGRVSLATTKEHAHGIKFISEAMVHAIATRSDLSQLLKNATVCVIGPGLGCDAWAHMVYDEVIKRDCPMVVDADALRILSQKKSANDNWLLTPHPKEAATLLGTDVKSIQDDRFEAANKLQKKYKGNIVLKGKGSIIHSSENTVYVCTSGNPGMAVAGMGDVLSGVLGGLLCQGLSNEDALKLGVLVHAKAGDIVKQKQGEIGILAHELIPVVRSLLNGQLGNDN